jgi:hypothetical protein
MQKKVDTHAGLAYLVCRRAGRPGDKRVDMDSKEETKAIRKALKEAGFTKLSVRQATGTSSYYGYIDINVTVPYTNENMPGRVIRSAMADAIRQVAVDATGRKGDKESRFSISFN